MRPTNLQFQGQQNQFEDLLPSPSLGGQVIQFTANNPLNIGDAVQMVANVTVDKLTTNPSKVIGIVVGGAALADQAIYQPDSATASALIQAGVAAATVAGQLVYVMTFGVYWAIADGAIAVGQPVKISGTTAGRVTGATVGLTINAGATAVTSSAANGAIIGGDGASGVFAVLIGAATVNPGDAALLFINV